MKKKYIADFYIVLWLLMQLHDIARTADILSVGVLGLIFVISIYYAFKVIQIDRVSPYFRALTILVILFSIYGFLLLASGEQIAFRRTGVIVSNRTYLINIYKSLLPIYPFYYFSIKGWITEKKLRIIVAILFVLVFFIFMQKQNDALSRAYQNQGDEVEEITNNAGYLIVALIPSIILFRNNKLIMYGGLFYCSTLTIIGMKRGAIIIAAICILVYLYQLVKHEKRRKKIITFTVASMALILIAYGVYQYYGESEYFQYRLAQTLEGNSSSRNYLYSDFLEYYLNQDNLLNSLFGIGANGTLKVSSNYAHNDWLEILINQGIIGVSLYLYYWLSLYQEWKKSKTLSEAYVAISMFIIVYFMKSLFSMSYASIPFYATMIFSFYLAKYKRYENTAHH